MTTQHPMSHEHADRSVITTDSPWEPVVGYSRAVVVQGMVFVSGTTAAGPDGAPVTGRDVEAQADEALDRIRQALVRAGSDLRHVVRTRIFVTDINDWEAVGRAHGRVFGDIRPATTMVEVSALIHPDLLVEIEAVAVLPPADVPS